MKTRNTFSKALALSALVGIMVVIVATWSAAPVSALKESDGRRDFGLGMVTLIPGQNARLSAVRIDDPNIIDDPNAIEDPNIRPCRTELMFFDSNGRQIGEPQRANLAPGQAFSSEVFGARMAGDEGAMQVRGDMRGYTEEGGGRNRCSVILTLEVFDRGTNGTLFLHPGIIRGFNPQPDPPGTEAQP